jgi:DNA polymerase-3 subunit delta'
VSCRDEIPVLEPLRRAHAERRLAHAFLIVGSPEGEGRRLAMALAQLVCCAANQKPCGACDECRRIARRDHPDVYWLEPEKKSRIISVGDPNKRHKDPGIRFRLLEPLAQTSYSGGWKVGVISWADRMSESAANALLKMLEEPPRETLLMLVTEHPHLLLPTIVSRCQRLILAERERPVEAAWRAELEEWLADAGARGSVTALARAARLLNLLDRVKEEIAKEEEYNNSTASNAADASDADEGDYNEAGVDEDSEKEENLAREFREARISSRLIKERTAMLRAIQLWQRDVLACKMGADAGALHFPTRRDDLAKQAAACDVATVYARIRAVDEASGRLATNMNALMVLDAMVRAGV